MYDYIFKYVIAGDYSTGKSAIVNRFLHNTYKHVNDTTIGVEFGSKIIYVKNKNIKLQIWDTAGQERFRSICTSYFKNNTCILLVFDPTRRDTFLHLKYWLNMLKTYVDANSLICIVSTKFDLSKENINDSELQQFLYDNDLNYFQCSSKNNTNIDNLFYETAEIIMNKINNNIIKEDDFKKLGIRPDVNKEIYNLNSINKYKKKSNEIKCCILS